MAIYANLSSGAQRIARNFVSAGQVELVTVHANGNKYTGWTKGSVGGSIKEASRTFTLSTTERSFAFHSEFNFPPGTEIQIKSNGDLLVDGYVDEYKPQISPEDHPVVITGRGKGADFIDSSAEHDDGGEEKNKTPLDLAKKLNKHGINITSSEAMKKIPMMRIEPGSSPWRNVERYARQQGFVLMGEANGDIKITKAVTQRHTGKLIEGKNIIDGSATLSQKNRHSNYNVKGSARIGTKEKDLRSEDKAKDPGVKRYRPKVLLMEGDTDKGRNKNRAETEANRRAGEGTKASIVVQGFHDKGGKLYEPSLLIYTASPSLKIDQDMMIESVEFEQSEKGGSLTKLELVDPRAYGGKKAGTSKSGKEWTGGFKESDPVGIGGGSL
jgi:prophage tail gpP-like protein